jgi:hypothetical protein
VGVAFVVPEGALPQRVSALLRACAVPGASAPRTPLHRRPAADAARDAPAALLACPHPLLLWRDRDGALIASGAVDGASPAVTVGRTTFSAVRFSSVLRVVFSRSTLHPPPRLP